MYPIKARLVFRLIIVLLLIIPISSTTSAKMTEGLPPLKIVQLGDSYSAGNGARSDTGAVNYNSVSGCYRSPTNWGSQFSASLKDTFAVTYINRACSGGVIADIQNERELESYFKSNIFEVCPTAKYPDEEEWRDDSITCSHFVDPQIEAIDSSVDLVLMTMGGNDLGFAKIVEKCFSLLRSPSGCEEAVKAANDMLDKPDNDPTGLKKKLIDTFAAIKIKLRDGAKVVYVSYPNLLLDDVEYKVESWKGTPFEDIYNADTEIRELSARGEEVQRAAVDAANAAAGEDFIVFYDDTKSVFEGHEPDPSLFNQNQDRWLREFEGLDMLEWYHANELGHENWGRALSSFETFGAATGSFDAEADVDVAFVVDTTGSMSGSIAQVRADMASLVNQLATTTKSYRVAVVSYRDFPERTGWDGDYASRVDQTFTSDLTLIQAAIDSLIAQGGGDWEETVFSGIQTALDLDWRPGVTKMTIVIGDAPALSPEPNTNYTPAQIVANSIALDPVQVMGVDVGYLNYYGEIGEISTGTGGSVIQGSTDLTTKISEILDLAVNQPFAWIGAAYSGKIGEPVLFDASGSYDPSGNPLTLYEWDFDGDGVYDLETTQATAEHVYDAAFDGFVIVRVTGDGGTALASAGTVINEQGFVSQGDEDSCELDENGYSIIVDEDGRPIACTADSLPEDGLDGVTETSGRFLYIPLMER